MIIETWENFVFGRSGGLASQHGQGIAHRRPFQDNHRNGLRRAHGKIQASVSANVSAAADRFAELVTAAETAGVQSLNRRHYRWRSKTGEHQATGVAIFLRSRARKATGRADFIRQD